MKLKQAFCTSSEAANMLACSERDVAQLVHDRRLDGVETKAFGLILRRWQVEALVQNLPVSLGASAENPDFEDFVWLLFLGRADRGFLPKRAKRTAEFEIAASENIWLSLLREGKLSPETYVARQLMRGLTKGRYCYEISDGGGRPEVQLHRRPPSKGVFGMLAEHLDPERPVRVAVILPLAAFAALLLVSAGDLVQMIGMLAFIGNCAAPVAYLSAALVILLALLSRKR